ncbi:unnamed protein product, partial [Ectocarpus sp. 12 AP-2014]
QEQCTLNQALIQDQRNPGLSLLAVSQTKDKEALTLEGVTRVIRELQKSFDYVVCDGPAGIESGDALFFPTAVTGARHAMYLADEAVIVTNQRCPRAGIATRWWGSSPASLGVRRRGRRRYGRRCSSPDTTPPGSRATRCSHWRTSRSYWGWRCWG